MAKRKQQQSKRKRDFVRPTTSPAAALEALQEKKSATAALEVELVEQMRAQGATWRQIATATGLNSPQAARYRFRRHHPPTDPADEVK